MLKKIHFNQIWRILLFGVFGYFFWLMLKLTLNYIPAQSDVQFLSIKQTEVTKHREYLPLFYIHVYTSIFVLLSGFLAIIRKDFGIRNLHKNSGKIYVLGILAFAAPTGIYMGWHANGGWSSQLSFIILGFLWIFTTWKAYTSIRKRNFKEHKQWMWRSFALTLSAITLRFWKVVIVYLFHPNPMDVYQIIAWLGWIPNLLLIEFLIKKNII